MTDSKGIAYKDGRYIPIEESFIHIMDPAFTKGDVVFDVVTVWDDNFFRLDDHLERFHSSCDYVRERRRRLRESHVHDVAVMREAPNYRQQS